MASIEEFAANLRGAFIQPTDTEYNESRKVYNAMIDKRPKYIVQAANLADVIYTVNFARENNILLAVRGGGHNGGGLGTCDDGVVLDLKGLNGVRVDAEINTVRVEGGCTWGKVDHATHAFGMAVPSGIISTTGVGGLTLGGGVGYLSRHYGLSIDNLLEADVVLADGSLVKASENEHEDLFWAIRGGGGNFGVITSFLFKLHPVNIDYAGPMFWELEDTKPVLQWYRNFILEAPEDMYGFFTFLQVPPIDDFPKEHHNKKVAGIMWCYTGDMDKAEEKFEPIRKIKPKPIVEAIGPMPHPALQSMFDGLYPPGHQWYWRADFVKEISDEAIEKHLEFAKQLPSPLSSMHLYPIDGAAHELDKNATAWSYRDANWAQVIVGVDPDPANKDKITSWTKAYFDALHPYSAGGAYINFMMDEGEERIKATYRDNYERLTKVKERYDPNNLFKVNQNIKPASVA